MVRVCLYRDHLKSSQVPEIILLSLWKSFPGPDIHACPALAVEQNFKRLLPFSPIVMGAFSRKQIQNALPSTGKLGEHAERSDLSSL
jgi:hypothetical protein